MFLTYTKKFGALAWAVLNNDSLFWWKFENIFFHSWLCLFQESSQSQNKHKFILKKKKKRKGYLKISATGET